MCSLRIFVHKLAAFINCVVFVIKQDSAVAVSVYSSVQFTSRVGLVVGAYALFAGTAAFQLTPRPVLIVFLPEQRSCSLVLHILKEEGCWFLW